MALQTHKVRRQVVELAADSQREAERLQEHVSRFNSGAVLPLIERYCSEASDSASLHRIDLLEVDLGRLDPHDFEADFLSKLAAALPMALAAEIRQREADGGSVTPMPGDPEAGSGLPYSVVASQLELLAFFARTGRLPWSVDGDAGRELGQTVHLLIERAPSALVRLLSELAREPTTLRRIVLFFSDEILEELVAVLTPSPGFSGDLNASRLLEAARTVGSSDDSSTVRTAVWSALLSTGARRAAAGSRSTADELTDFWRDAIALVAASLGASYAALLDALVSGRSDVVRSSTEDTISWQLYQELPEAAPDDLTMESIVRADLGVAHRLVAASPSAAPHVEAPRPSERLSGPTIDESEPVYVENSGLVILWPFIERFFERVGLAEARHLRDAPAAQRAVGLLQYVTTEDPLPPEYLVSLNKALCGVELTEPFDFGPPVTATEAEECDDLVQATIEQAPILKSMSILAFRTDFLTRAGSLSTRDGAWLLRVERQTQDVVLDRLPWEVQWVGLPWMPRPLLVEW